MLDKTSQWQDLVEKASREQDPKELLKLINDLCDILDREGAERASKVLLFKNT